MSTALTNLDRWNYYLRDLEAPQIFIDWSYYWTISSALQRKVWMGNYSFSPIFSNLYIMFVADPGVGKSTAARIGGQKILKTFRFLDAAKIKAGLPAEKAWTDALSFSADNTTLQSLIQQLNKSVKTFQIPWKNEDGILFHKPAQHSSMAILLSEEMTSMFSVTNEGITDFLNQCYDAQDYHYKTKHQGEEQIKNVYVSFLGCTTPENVKKLMARGVLQTGFTARTIPIFASKPRKRNLEYEFNAEQTVEWNHVTEHIKKLLEVTGEVSWSLEAKEYFKHYYGDKLPVDEKSPMQKDRVNFDKRTEDYYGRKKLHITKMAMVLHFSENLISMEISLATLLRAINVLKEVELEMHNALASSGRNELADYGREVLDALKKNKTDGISKIHLRALFWDDIDEKELEDILKFLEDTGKIKGVLNNTSMRMHYYVK